MRRRKLIGDRRIGNTPPIGGKMGTFTAIAIAKSLKVFVEKYLTGAATIEVSEIDTGDVTIATLHAAYLIRCAVEELEVDSELKISVTGEYGFLRIHFRHEGEMSEDLRKRLSEIALLAGFELVSDVGEFAILTRMVRTDVLPLYQSTNPFFIIDLYDIFFTIDPNIKDDDSDEK